MHTHKETIMGNCATAIPQHANDTSTIERKPTKDSDRTSLPISEEITSSETLLLDFESPSPPIKSLARPSDLLLSVRLLARASDLFAPSSLTSATTRRQSRATHHALELENVTHLHVRDVVTHVLGRNKDQDRAVCVPNLLPGVLYAGVFDGHGRSGEIRSELATTELPKLIKSQLECLHSVELKESDLQHALESSYSAFHKQLDTLYEETVFKKAVQMAKENYGNQVTELDVRMPQDGGTTATSVLVSGDLLLVGWVGDSRAVLCRRPTVRAHAKRISNDTRGGAAAIQLLNRIPNHLKISPLTEDHNVATNICEEMDRVADKGGEIHGNFLAVSQAEGMLQLTRSLGDSPFHRTGLVVSKPGVVTIPMFDDGNDPLLFLLVASDGLWDYFTNEEAMRFVYKRLRKENYADRDLTDMQRGEVLTNTARAMENEVIRRTTERNSHVDDITVLILTFTKGWELEAEEMPSF